MKNMKRLCLLSTLQFLSIPMAFGASVGSLKTIGITPEDKAVIQALFEKEVARYPKREEKINLTMVQLKAKILMEVTSEIAGHRISSRETNLNSLDEIDLALSRSLEALIENKALKETAERGKAVGGELKNTTKVRSVQGFQVSLGTAAPMTKAFRSYQPLGSIALSYAWDLDPWIIEARGDWAFGFGDEGGHLLSTSIGGHYTWLSERQYAVFSGLDLGFGTASLKDPNSPYDRTGYAASMVGLNTGILLLRHADVNFEIRARVQSLTRKVNDSVPLLGGISLGIRF